MASLLKSLSTLCAGRKFSSVTLTRAAEVTSFWFSQDEAVWWRKDENFDSEIREKFKTLHDSAAKGELDNWENEPQSALALIIVLDQFSRNLYRGRPEAFANDAKALQVCEKALAKGFDKDMNKHEKHFLNMPLMHAENLEAQKKSLVAFNNMDFAKDHYDIVAKFGRFPHRNDALGRKSTPEEIEFMKTHKGF